MEKEDYFDVTMRDLWKRFYTGRQLIFICILFLLSCWGTIDGFYDPRGHGMIGWFGYISIAIVAIVQVTSILWEKKHDLADVIKRTLFGTFCGAAPLIIANGIFLVGAWLLLSGATDIANPAINHYWSAGSLGLQLWLLVLIQYSVLFLSGSCAFIVVILPVLSIIKPDELAKDSNLLAEKNEKVRRNTTRFFYIGPALLLIGMFTCSRILKTTVYGKYYLPEIWKQMMWIVEDIRNGVYGTEQVVGLLGIICLVTGSLLLIWGWIRIRMAEHLNKSKVKIRSKMK